VAEADDTPTDAKAPTDAEATADAEPTRARIPWATFGLVVLVLAGAHLGGYLLLTAQARKEKRAIEEQRGLPALEAAVEPAAVAPGNVAAYREYRKALDLWEDRRRRDQLAERSSMFATWFGGALLVELMLGVIGVVKVLGSGGSSARKSVRRPRPTSSRGR
jgi:hypothetical protein